MTGGQRSKRDERESHSEVRLHPQSCFLCGWGLRHTSGYRGNELWSRKAHWGHILELEGTQGRTTNGLDDSQTACVPNRNVFLVYAACLASFFPDPKQKPSQFSQNQKTQTAGKVSETILPVLLSARLNLSGPERDKFTFRFFKPQACELFWFIQLSVKGLFSLVFFVSSHLHHKTSGL